MGETYRKAMIITEALYNATWKKADAEYERNGEISQATMDKIARIELEMMLLEASK